MFIAILYIFGIGIALIQAELIVGLKCHEVKPAVRLGILASVCSIVNMVLLVLQLRDISSNMINNSITTAMMILEISVVLLLPINLFGITIMIMLNRFKWD